MQNPSIHSTKNKPNSLFFFFFLREREANQILWMTKILKKQHKASNIPNIFNKPRNWKAITYLERLKELKKLRPFWGALALITPQYRNLFMMFGSVIVDWTGKRVLFFSNSNKAVLFMYFWFWILLHFTQLLDCVGWHFPHPNNTL